MAAAATTAATMATANTLEDIARLSQNPRLCLFFWAPWHEPSRPGGQMDQVLQSLQTLVGDAVSFVKVEAEAAPEISAHYNVTVVPTFICIRGGSELSRLEGADAAALASLIQRFAVDGIDPPIQSAPVATASPTTESLEERLRRLISSSSVMVFMKGTGSEPKCKFSRKLVEILTTHSVPFSSFDILKDNEVREGLKKLSDWPTYPQLYVNGTLIGGVDVVEQMLATGNLAEQFGLNPSPSPSLSAEQSLNDRLRALVRQSEVVLFMKGTPEAPRCGFSRSVVELLRTEAIEFTSFDILTDEQVRAGLKTLFDWPTYPQLYVRGELMGGLDILKEMKATGPLKPQLNL